jgi:hypothetical protein
MPVWVGVPLSKVTDRALKNRSDILRAANIPDVIPTAADDLDPIVRIHVDYLDEDKHLEYRTHMMTTYGRPGEYFYDIGSQEWSCFLCHHRHNPNVCRCNRPIYHIGQDEAVFKQFAMSARTWSILGKTKLRPKTEGMGIMVSAVFDEWRGFGLQLTESEVNLINNVREAAALLAGVPPRKKIQVGDSPGLIFFQYGNGKGKQGYWDGVKFQEQCIDFMDVLEILYPDMQILLEVDHSSGHLKEQSDGLMVNAMGIRWGGKTVPKRDSVMEEGCLGENPPFVNGRQLTLGSVQKMKFEVGDEGPFYEPRALRHDTPMSAEEIVKEKEKRKRKKPVSVSDNDVEGEGGVDVGAQDAPYVSQGFEGKNKGIKQILYERGLYLDGMQGRQAASVKEKYLIAGMAHKIVPDHLDAHAVLSACPDFQFERTALQNVIESRGHILLPSVVCTPETAGGGIEYAWGKLKFEQRRQNESAVRLEAGVKFIERVKILCTDKSILPLDRLYLEFGERQGKTALTYKEIETMRTVQKTHRNIMEVDRKFVQAE